MTASIVAGGRAGHSSAAGGGSGETRRTILVVDADAAAREQMRALLAETYDVLEARDGVEAFALYERHAERIAAVVTEYALPRLDGEQLAGMLASAAPSLPVVVVTWSAGSACIERLCRLPKFIMLWKPFEARVLLELLEVLAAAGEA